MTGTTRAAAGGRGEQRHRRPSRRHFAHAGVEGDPPQPDDSHGSRAGRALIGYLRTQRDQLHHNDPLARAGDVDGVHDMRVATRRLRSTLRTYRPLLNIADPDALDAELAWLADTLGAVRDRDVLTDNVLADIAHHAPEFLDGPVTARIRRRLSVDQTAARTDLAAALDGQRYRILLDTLGRTADQPASDPARSQLYRRARACLARADHRLGRALMLDSAGDDAAQRDTALHAARKAYKRARYAVDALIPLAGNCAQQLAGHVGDIQDALGAHQDASIAAALLAELGEQARAEGESEAPYRLLYDHQRAIAARQRHAAAKLYRATKHRKLRRWLSA